MHEGHHKKLPSGKPSFVNAAVAQGHLVVYVGLNEYQGNAGSGWISSLRKKGALYALNNIASV